jgi:hypothetical protein
MFVCSGLALAAATRFENVERFGQARTETG